jgi:DNA primase
LAALTASGFTADDLIEAGLFRLSERNKGEIYPFFRDRVMFPVTDLQGRIVAFGGRVLAGAPKEAPKYINSPESPIFHKGRNLYALSRARKAIGEGAPVIVVEGYMDVIALHQAGFNAAVAPLGTALTESQIEELWKAMPEDGRTPILCFDGDAAGQRAATRALDRILPILKPDHSVRFAFLPEEHDPDSLIKAEGRGAMDRVLSTSISLFEMMWMEDSKGRNFSQPEARAGFKSALTKRARQIADATVQEFFISQVNQKINDVFLSNKSTNKTPAERRFSKGAPLPPGAHTPVRPLAISVKPPKSKKYLREKILIAAMINHPQLYEEFSEQFGLLNIDSLDYDQLRQAVIDLLNAQNGLDDQAVKQHLIESGHGKTLDAIFDASLYLHAGFAKPGQPYEIVQQGWLDMYDRSQVGFRSS